MLIATDQEHGVVSRVWAPATEFPGNMALGATRRPRDAQAAARITAKELGALGINQNYAPVADVNINPLNPVIGVRSFGESPDLVSDMTAAAVHGSERAGVSATLKHFPGHGDTVTDSHTGVPWIFHDREQWEETDAPPFRAGIAAGVDMIMTAHVVMPELQSDCDLATQEGCDPATLDPEILTGLLREELGYRGVVVTDALNMAGVREKYGDARIPVLALKAGVDMPMMVDTDTDTVSLDVAYTAVLDAVRNGELTEQRIDESVYRVLKLKRERGLFRDPFVNERRAARRLGTPRHLARARRVGEHGVTLIKNDAGLLPLAAGDGKEGAGHGLPLRLGHVQRPAGRAPRGAAAWRGSGDGALRDRNRARRGRHRRRREQGGEQRHRRGGHGQRVRLADPAQPRGAAGGDRKARRGDRYEEPVRHREADTGAHLPRLVLLDATGDGGGGASARG